MDNSSLREEPFEDAASSDAVTTIRRGITSFHDSITKRIYGENAAYDATSHDPDCRRCAALAALDTLEASDD